MSPRPRIYLDHAATTPILPAAKAAMVEALERWANPSSPHAEGRAARAALEDARERIKRALGWTGELIFTSGATEAIDIALGRTDRRVLVSAVEHDAVFRAAPGAQILPIGERAEVDRTALAVALAGRPPCVIAIQHVNSETGVIQPVTELAAAIREADGLTVSDCSQSAGKMPLPDADILIVSGHKLGGPPGIGALLVKDLAMLPARGGQEFGYRGGTQNVPGALGFATAVEAWLPDGRPSSRQTSPSQHWAVGLGELRAGAEEHLVGAGGVIQPFAADPSIPPMCLSAILSLTMPGVTAQVQLIRLDGAGISVSAGSACSSGSLKPSRALAGFGVPEREASCTIRVSFGWPTTAAEIGGFADAWLDIAASARNRAA